MIIFKCLGYFEKVVVNDVDVYVLKECLIDDLIKIIYKVIKGEKEYSFLFMILLFIELNLLIYKE